MASNLEDSFQSGLEYDAEVAYISMTSPTPINSTVSNLEEEDEFDFTDNPMTAVPQENTSVSSKESESSHHTKDLSPLVTNKESTPLHQLQVAPKLLTTPPLVSPGATAALSPAFASSSPLSPTISVTPDLSPLALTVPHFTLDTDYLPSTPTSQLRRIKEAQIPPSPRQRVKLAREQQVCGVMVVYGPSGCGRTYLVDKLTLSNPSIFARVVPSTTRRRRPNEVDGVDFHFISHQEMAQGLAKGEFIESIKVQKKSRSSQELRRKILTSQTSNLAASDGDTEGESSPSPQPRTRPTKMEAGKRYESSFELSPEDTSGKSSGETFGTSYKSLTEAIQLGKPCVLLNVSTKGARQLKKAGLHGSYVHIHNDKKKLVEANELADHSISTGSLDQAYTELHQHAFSLVTDLNLPSSTSYQEAKYEWEALPTVQFEQTKSTLQRYSVEVTFSELLAHFNSNAQKQLERARAEQVRSKFLQTKLSKKLSNEKLLVLAVSYLQIDDKERLHLRILQTIYYKLTGNTLNCRRFGTHWQEIGFSGPDPAEDLHEVGLLGLTQLVYSLENPRRAKLSKEIFQYCKKDTHTVQFCVMSLRFSRLAVEVLEMGALNKICNKRDQVFVIVNEFYMAAFYHYYTVWKASQKSILQLDLLMEQCCDHCRMHPKQVLQRFDQYFSITEPQNELIPALLPKVDNITPFEDITTSN